MQNKNVLVIGAARTGVAASKLLLSHNNHVTLTDNRKTEAIVKEFPMIEQELEELNQSNDNRLETVFGEQIDPERIKEFDLIVPSPGVPETIPIIQAAIKEEIPIISEPELTFRLSDTPFIAITGTNGKTTTTTLTGEIFKDAGLDTYVVGNIGDAISNYVDQTDENSVFITEIGSFQLDRTIDFRPKGAVILNITPDHLDRHKTMENYIAAKSKIYQNQGEGDFSIINIDDPITSKIEIDPASRRLEISLNSPVSNGAYYSDGILKIVDNGEEIDLISKEDLGIKGPHNIQNALAASSLAYFSGIDPSTIRKTLKAFSGVEHRQEYVDEVDGVIYINDSKGTNTDAAITALNAMERPTILIAGGYDKKEAYDNLSEKIKEKVKQVVLFGKTAPAIEENLKEHGYNDVLIVNDLKEATDKAREFSESGDTVLLSPACASWDMFDNYEQRGDLFKEIVKSYKS